MAYAHTTLFDLLKENGTVQSAAQAVDAGSRSVVSGTDSI